VSGNATSRPLAGELHHFTAETESSYPVVVEHEAAVAMDACEYLFLTEIEELHFNGLRVS
jgi:hypothetical protein